jgi:hypothetical protein
MISNAGGGRDGEASRSSEALGSRRELQESGFIVIRIATRVDDQQDDENLLAVVSRLSDYRELERFLRSNGLVESTRSMLSIAPQRVRQWEAMADSRAATRVEDEPDLTPLRSLLQYWRIDTRSDSAIRVRSQVGLGALAAQLRNIPGVEMARVEYKAMPPAPGEGAVTYSDETESAEQTHLDAAHAVNPGGINAKALWLLDADGSDVGLVDVEYGWDETHPEFAGQTINFFNGDDYDASFERHGTAVLGVVAAGDNGFGVVGIAPRVRDLSLASARKGAMGEVQADAIGRAIGVCQPGDVILLELQANDKDGTDLPAEFVDDTFDAIRLASALGFVVIEPAGNGGADLEARPNDAGDLVLRGGFRESGSIMVAASDRGPAYTKHATSNYGTRVNCFAPGESVKTCNQPRFVGDSDYRNDFSQTSAASAILAGAAVLLQSLWKAKTGNVLSPTQMRRLLSDGSINTQPDPAWDGLIGVMPDLSAIADSQLPDIYLRDNLSDHGILPSAGALSQSPDIIVRSAAVVGDLQAAYGQGSGTEERQDLSDSVTAGRDHFLYARVRNRGAVDANGVTVDLYWSQVSTLVVPRDWAFIGTTPAVNVAADDTLKVSGPVTWPAAAIPQSGHYCFVGVASHANDLPPAIPPKLVDWDTFVSFVGNNNNIAWRNFNVVDQPLAPNPMALPFDVTGDPEDERAFTLAVVAYPLPVQRLELIMPPDLADLLPQWDRDRTTHPDGIHLDVTRTGGLREAAVALPAGARYRCELRVTPPWRGPRGRRRVMVVQRYRGVVVGGISWAFRQ